MCFEYILPAHFIEHFREMLLECNDKIINTHYTPFSYCREMEVYGEPWAVPKQKIMRAVAHDGRPHSVRPELTQANVWGQLAFSSCDSLPIILMTV